MTLTSIGPRPLLGLIGLCVATRLLMLAFWPENYALFPVDVDGYWQISGNIWAGNGYALGPEPIPTAYRPPAYPLFLAGIHWLIGDRPAVALASQAALDAATLIATYFLAMVVIGSQPVAYLACFFWAVYLPEAASITRFWSEPLCALILTSALLVFILARKRNTLWLYGLSGLILGAVALTRPEFLLLPLLLAISVLTMRGEKFGRRVYCASLVLLGCVMLLTPWTVRNALVFNAFIPATSVGGLVLFLANAPLDEDNYLVYRGTPYGLRRLEGRAPPPLWTRTQAERLQGSETALDRLYAREAWRLIRDYPVRFAKLSLVRFFRLWFNVGFGRPLKGTSLAVAVINSVLVILGVIGWLTVRRTWEGHAVPLVLALLYVTLVHMPTEALVKYVFPVVPALAVLSASGLIALWTRPRLLPSEVN